ncbi:MAG: hypothetical protein COV75_02595 [Candidatus Omnitrophica bacterium CG11_big_fil_rev_8_21_14_0_20_63_9]|nr:MAG: hypothetical protein COV75_02595 [Candidatus Omnitrophica bacterium CG11_big_fil_rev_8_21_14_0_20_63_9]
MNTRWWFAVVGCLIAAGWDAQEAGAVVLDVFSDAYITDLAPGGTLDGLPDSISNTGALLAGKGILSSGAAIDSRPIMIFDVSSYGGLTLSSALLSGYGGGVDHNFAPETISANFFGIPGDGIVSLADFDRAATAVGSHTFDGVSFQTFELFPFSFDVTPYVQTLLTQTDPFAEFRVESDELTVLLNAGEAAVPFSVDTRFPGPRLSLTFADSGAIIPEPGTFGLFLTGITGLVATRHRRRSLPLPSA